MYRFYFLPIIAIMFLESCFSDKTDNGLKTIYFEGTKKVKQIINYTNGLKNGEAKEFYPDGILKARRFYCNDTICDTSFMYHPNGQLRSLQVTKNNKAHGRWQEFNKEGVLYKELFFKAGLMDSTCTEYTYRTGRLLTRINYKMGRKHGFHEEYYANGNPKFKTKYQNNTPLKGLQEWHENGKIIVNDFKIHVSENNEVLLKNTLSYNIRLEGSKPNDKVYQELSPSNSPDETGALFPLKNHNGMYILQFEIPKGNFIMKKITIVAIRITGFGNAYIKTHSFNVSSNNF